MVTQPSFQTGPMCGILDSKGWKSRRVSSKKFLKTERSMRMDTEPLPTNQARPLMYVPIIKNIYSCAHIFCCMKSALCYNLCMYVCMYVCMHVCIHACPVGSQWSFVSTMSSNSKPKHRHTSTWYQFNTVVSPEIYKLIYQVSFFWIMSCFPLKSEGRFLVVPPSHRM